MDIKDNLKMATGVTMVTLVGFIRGVYPMERGNCFSVSTENDGNFRIINFNHENLQELENRGIISFPLKISVLGGSTAIICDERIPNEWYSNRFCETCTPREFLPLTQKLKHYLDIERGVRVENEIEIDGKKMTMVTIKVEGKTRKI